jgi:phosphoglycerate dehydrogenase-like enzyme
MKTTTRSDISSREVYIPDTEASERMGLTTRLQELGAMVRVGSSFSTSAALLTETIGGAEVLCVALARVERAAIAAGSNLRLIVKCGIGTENIDLDAAYERSVTVLRTTGVNVRGVAEYVIAACLAHLRGFETLDHAVRSGQWTDLRIVQAGRIPSLSGRTIGIVGLGAIGREVAALARAHGMTILTSDPNLDSNLAAASGANLVSLPNLLARSDIVTLHVVLDETTHHLIGAHEFSLMKPDALLVNAARGAVVDTDALVNALQARTIAHAVVDVLEQEPPALDHPLLELDNCTLTPHLAGCTDAGYAEIGQRASQLVNAYMSGATLPPDCVVSSKTASHAR